ncbi:hypothetical protein GCM10027029_12040 [Conyzicola lurida]|nr:hypothetical protein [Conyzicola lurida]
MQRTYRNLRIGIAGTVVLIVVSVGVTAASTGLLPSISAYYYTPARNVFVGALIAAAVAILAISGRGVQRALLDAAGLFAPLIALVPAPVREGTIPGYDLACDAGESCVPPSVIPDIDVGVATYLIAGAAAVVVSIALFARDGSLPRRILSIAVAVVVFAAVLVAWLGAREAFIGSAHFVAAALFFGLVAAAAVANVVAPVQLERPPLWHRVLYSVVAVGMVVDIVVIAVAIRAGDTGRGPLPPVLVGEFVALALFVVFWVLQSAEKWADEDPAVAAQRAL